VIDADVELSVPSRAEYVALVRYVVGAAARMGELSPNLIDNAKLAVSEATTNAVTTTAGSAEPVQIAAAVKGDRVLLEVLDRGTDRPSGEPDRAADADSEADSLDFSFERGLSLSLIEGLVDHLEIRPREGGGSALSMTLIDQLRPGDPPAPASEVP
jgi:serine/threonine-protein kinase RsbW